MKSILTRENYKKTGEKGITLIALVVTIIVLLILAGVSIMMLTGQNGILRRAEEAGTSTAHAEVYEILNLQTVDYMTESKLGNYSGTLIDYLKDKEYITETDDEGKYKINVEKLLGQKGKYGNGEGDIDVYKLEEVLPDAAKIEKVATKEVVKIAATETNKTYNVIYYGKSGSTPIPLGKLQDGNSSTTTGERLEDMYCLYGWYDNATNNLESVQLSFIPEFYEKVYEENQEEFTMTEEELVMKDHGTEATTWEEFMEELLEKNWTDKIYDTAKDWYIDYYGFSEEGYNEEIKRDIMNIITVESPDEENYNYTINGMGQYECILKIDGKTIKTFNVNIKQHEVVYCCNSYNEDVHASDYVIAYNFLEHEILTINDARYTYYVTSGEISNDSIKNIEEIGGFVTRRPGPEGTYIFKLNTEKGMISGYVPWYNYDT